MHGDVARVLVGQQFRFWLKAALATLCFFLALYCVLFAVAASAPATGAPVLALRVAGFALPLLLIARVAYLYRRQKIHALAAQLDEVFVIRDFQATRDFEATVDAAVENEYIAVGEQFTQMIIGTTVSETEFEDRTRNISDQLFCKIQATCTHIRGNE